ncbi:GDSL-like Lipase/Acylhydrolase [compost metagenome]
MKNILFALLFSISQLFVYAQHQPLFKNGDKVAFVGNSITNNGEFHNNIFLYYATRFPKEKIEFYNCGISGDVASGMLKRLESDVFIHQPNWTVLMVGMNDVRRTLYSAESSSKPNVVQERTKALDLYKKNTDDLVKALAAKTKVILQKPTIYDQTVVLDKPNDFGVNDALGKCAEMVQELSIKYGTGLVDYFTIMNSVNAKVQQSNPSATIIGPDRVHPGSPGHLLMAYQFLKSTNASKYVAKMVIENSQSSINQKSENCVISNLKWSLGEISFSCLENSLPFPVKEAAAEALNWVPFYEDLNQEVLQVNALKAGNYELSIDGEHMATYSSAQLSKGINLSLIKTTPQYRQALNVLKLCTEMRGAESVLRNLKFVEIIHLAELKQTQDTTVVRQFLNERLKKLESSPNYNYHVKQFNGYFVNKTKQHDLEQKIKRIRQQIYQVNLPVVHQYKLKFKS